MNFRHTVLALLAALAAGSAQAFPPAPSFILHGVARDAFGWSLKASDQATVVVKRGDGLIVAQAPVNETLRAGENFRVAVPMDTRPSDPYRPAAQTSGALLHFEVRFPGGVTLPVLSINTDHRTVGLPGGMQFVDFTLGVDSDGDGIPDQWEWWQLSEMGIGPGHPLWSLATFGNGDFDGNGVSDYHEYLAGTFAFLNHETLALTIEGFTPGGEAVLKTLQVEEKTYRVEWSPDLKSWSRAHVRRDLPGAAAGIHWTASDTREVTLYSPASVGKPGLFYRLILVR